MADVTFAHVPRPVWRNQMVIAPDAGNSVRRIAIGRDARHDTLTGLCNGDACQCAQGAANASVKQLANDDRVARQAVSRQ